MIAPSIGQIQWTLVLKALMSMTSGMWKLFEHRKRLLVV